MNDGEKKQLML